MGLISACCQRNNNLIIFVKFIHIENIMRKILSVIIFVFCQYFVIAQSPLKGSDIVATVNDEPITAAEFDFFAQRNKYKVISMFRKEHKLQYHGDFWNDKSKGKIPGDVLKEMTLDSIVNLKVQYMLAKQYGIINDISFQAIQQYLKTENKQRQEALKKNIVIYGPEQYSMENYYDYLTSNMVIKLKDYLVRNGMIQVDISKGIPRTDDKNISHDDDKDYSPAHIMNMQVNQQYKAIITPLIKKAKIKINKKQMKELVL